MPSSKNFQSFQGGNFKHPWKKKNPQNNETPPPLPNNSSNTLRKDMRLPPYNSASGVTNQGVSKRRLCLPGLPQDLLGDEGLDRGPGPRGAGKSPERRPGPKPLGRGVSGGVCGPWDPRPLPTTRPAHLTTKVYNWVLEVIPLSHYRSWPLTMSGKSSFNHFQAYFRGKQSVFLGRFTTS